MPEAQINPRYSKYSNKEIEALLDRMSEQEPATVAEAEAAAAELT